MTEDVDIFPWLVAFQQCLCEGLATDSPESPVCFCGILPGSDLSTEWADGGQAWVRLMQAYPSKTFPEPEVESTPCGTGTAYQIEMGVLRCMPKPSELTGKVDEGLLLNVIRQQLADMQTMRRAITCCVEGDYDLILNTYTPWGPEGGIYGGIWNFYISGAKG